MALPVVKNLRFSVHVAELNRDIKYRAMTTGEQKLYIQAINLGDEKVLNDVNLNIVEACTFGEVDLKKIPTHVVDFIYLQIYMKSKGEVVPASYVCQADVKVKKTQKVKVVDEETGEEREEDQEIEVETKCGENMSIKIPLNKAILKYPEGYEAKRVIMVDETTGVKLRVPAFGDYWEIDQTQEITGLAEDYLYQCVDCIFDGENVQTPGTDFTITEFKEWYNTLPSSTSEKIDAFFEELPILALDLPLTCPKCGTKHEIKLRGLSDFFV